MVPRRFFRVLAVFMFLSHLPSLHAEINSFQNPSMSTWGGWSREDMGTVYAAWDEMSPLENFVSNYTPDVGQYGVLVPDSPAGAEIFVIPYLAYLTGTKNYYHQDREPYFYITLVADADHQDLQGEVSVALQLAVIGADIDDSKIRLNCISTHADDDGNSSTNDANDDGDSSRIDTPVSETDCIPFDEKVVLETGIGSGPGAGQDGVDNEYLYTWRLPAALNSYRFHITALGTSLSLDAVSVDIGPASGDIVEENVPIPFFAVFGLGAALMWIGRTAKAKS